MEKNISDYRKSYEKGELLLKDTPHSPLDLFGKWFVDVDNHFENSEANALTISTIGKDGFPKSRIVLLKQWTNEGFIFYTNYDSEKGKAIALNPNVCLSFFWEGAERQVIIKGEAKKVDAAVSDAYFHSRPEGSQMGAIVSDQSQIIEDRSVLEDRLVLLKEKYQKEPIVRPQSWGGFIVKPISVEFWQGRANRLHDRVLYTIDTETNKWVKNRLAP